ncbi:TetR/AcrR family transcriptional regulator C-terminal domain-containing protein [Nocardia sp. NPDC058176]|uniref:TetR/AcrR family transcriptional regulator C-terminal domain-containing protein n=1 Tax=Nocardia sp. NPDC058176 TaxID=3346368 RepID=UPI0036DDEDED
MLAESSDNVVNMSRQVRRVTKSGRPAGQAVAGETMVSVALSLVETVGLEGLTMRRLADEAGVQAPALYRRFASKQDLLDAMVERIIGEALADPALPHEGDWGQQLAALAHSLRRALLAHRDSARILSGSLTGERNVLSFNEAALTPLIDAGFPPTRAAWGGDVVMSYTMGQVLRQQTAQDSGLTAAEGAARVRQNLAKAPEIRLPVDLPLEQIADVDARFEYGLHVIITGLAYSLAHPA